MSSSNFSFLEIPISLRWKISKEKLQSKLQRNNQSIASEEFKIDQISGAKYYLEIVKANLNGVEKILVGLTLDIKTSIKVNAVFRISIPSSNFSSKAKCVYVKREFYAKKICTFNELFYSTKNYFVNGFLTVTMEGILTIDINEPLNVLYNNQLKINNLGSILWNRDNKDFAFIVDEKEIKVHKLVITAKSEVFERMIESGLKESKESKVFITDFAFEIVEIALKFCYGIEDPNLWKIENAVKLIQFADKYDINDLKISMENFLLSKISAMNVCEISNASILSNSIQLREECFDFILECNKKSISINNMKLLDKDFAMEIFQASFAYCSL